MRAAHHSSMFYRMIRTFNGESAFLHRQMYIILEEVKTSGYLVNLCANIEFTKACMAYQQSIDKLTQRQISPELATEIRTNATVVVTHIRNHLTEHDVDYRKLI
jgi:hypothetical protein